jgi:hypothetical protein
MESRFHSFRYFRIRGRAREPLTLILESLPLSDYGSTKTCAVAIPLALALPTILITSTLPIRR